MSVCGELLVRTISSKPEITAAPGSKRTVQSMVYRARGRSRGTAKLLPERACGPRPLVTSRSRPATSKPLVLSEKRDRERIDISSSVVVHTLANHSRRSAYA